MPRPPTPDFSMLLVNEGGDPSPKRLLDPPRSGVVTVRTYGGELVTLEVDVVARSGQWLCVAQAAPPDWPSWFAWVPAASVQPARGAPAIDWRRADARSDHP